MSLLRKRTLAIGLLLCIVFLTFISAPLTAQASDNSGVGYNVRPVFPANQSKEQQGYFQLDMKAGDVQKIEVVVRNTSSQAIQVEVVPQVGITNSVGNIEYTEMTKRDDSMKYAFTDIAVADEPLMNIPANSDATCYVTLTMPKEEFDGIILGGIVFTKVPEKTEAEGMALTNVYSYVIGTVLRETSTVVPPIIDLVDVHADVVNYRAAVVHTMNNTAAVIADELKLEIGVYKKGGSEPLWSATNENVRMAPNTVMEYAFYPDSAMEVGKYESRIKIYNTEHSWEFTKEFEVKADEAAKINEEALIKPEEKTAEPIPGWAIAVIVVVAVLIIFVIVLLLALLKRQKKNTPK